MRLGSVCIEGEEGPPGGKGGGRWNLNESIVGGMAPGTAV